MRVDFYKADNGSYEIWSIWIRIHFFKPSGKWYASEEIKWVEAPNKLAHSSLLYSIKQANLGHEGMMAICIKNPAGYPLMIKKMK